MGRAEASSLNLQRRNGRPEHGGRGWFGRYPRPCREWRRRARYRACRVRGNAVAGGCPEAGTIRFDRRRPLRCVVAASRRLMAPPVACAGARSRRVAIGIHNLALVCVGECAVGWRGADHQRRARDCLCVVMSTCLVRARGSVEAAPKARPCHDLRRQACVFKVWFRRWLRRWSWRWRCCRRCSACNRGVAWPWCCTLRYGDEQQQSGVMAVAQAFVSSTIESGDMIK